MSIKRFFLNSWEWWYKGLITLMIVMYPIFVSDGQSWRFDKQYGLELPTNYQIHGIDISRHNGIIDWQKINDERTENNLIKFVFIKATEGGDLLDVNFETNWKKAKEHGFIRGAYHFYVSYTDPKLQALNFIINARHEKGDFVPILDFENNGRTEKERRELSKNVKIWLDTVEKYLEVKPIIYTNKPIFKEYIKGKLDEYPIWVADYYSENLNNFDCKNLILWQHSDKGKVPGIKKNVDFNVFLGTPHKFQKFIH